MPKWIRYVMWGVAAIVALHIIMNNPHGAGHSVGAFLASLWAFIGSI